MRIISGRFKGFQLPPAKPGTRPTTDRTKEAMFSRLDALGVLDGARVLDLFAGTGALGIEALSRGANELLAVESAGPAAVELTRTLKSLTMQRSWDPSAMHARVMRKRAERFTAGYHGPAFDLILADPPYEFSTEACNALIIDLTDSPAVNEKTIMLFERSVRSQALEAPKRWTIDDCREYGETKVFTFSVL